VSTIKWFRVDDRLIHGQVMVGWVIAFGVERIILANDRIAKDPWYQDTLRTVVDSFSEDVDLSILTLEELVSCFVENQLEGTQMLLVESISDAEFLYRHGGSLPVLNLGGIHAREGRDKFLSFLYLDSAEIDAILELSLKGIKVIAQDLPDSKAIDVVKLIERKRRE
jgi:mannose/fructose/N-acetylgalactosamine-specific phosphotransferase system component IIB